jgi:hypothetical protein
MFSPKTEDFGGSLDVAAIVDFVDSGRNLLLVATPDSSDTIRELAAECGIALVDEERAYVQDHFAHDVVLDEGNHTIVVSDDFAAPDIVLGKVRTNRAARANRTTRRAAFAPPRPAPPLRPPAPAPAPAGSPAAGPAAQERPGPVLFRGAGLAVAGANPLVLPILRAASTAYSMVRASLGEGGVLQDFIL